MMKRFNLLLMSLMLLVFVTSCSKDDAIPETLTFTIDGVAKSFSKTITVVEYSNGVEIIGTTSGLEKIVITLPNKGTGVYTQATFNAMGGSATKPNIRYTDSNGNNWQYYGSAYGAQYVFNISVEKYDSKGEISGTFNGTMDYSISNGSSAPHQVVITNGVFSHEMPSTTTK